MAPFKNTVKPLILGYHYLNLPGEIKPGPSCSMERFESHLKRLRRDHCNVLTLSEIAQAIKRGENLPPRTAGISFDDGLKDGYERAFPLLKRYGYPATFFIITCALEGKLPPVIAFQILIRELGADKIREEILPNFLAGTGYAGLLDPERYDIRDDKKPEPEEFRLIKWIFNHFLPASLQTDFIEETFAACGLKSEESYCQEMFMRPDELLAMSENGMDIASHTHTHPLLAICGKNDVILQLVESRAILTDLLSCAPTCFSWPFGGEIPARAKAVAPYYYQAAWNWGMGSFRGNWNDVYSLPRHDQAELDF